MIAPRRLPGVGSTSTSKRAIASLIHSPRAGRSDTPVQRRHRGTATAPSAPGCSASCATTESPARCSSPVTSTPAGRPICPSTRAAYPHDRRERRGGAGLHVGDQRQHRRRPRQPAPHPVALGRAGHPAEQPAREVPRPRLARLLGARRDARAGVQMDWYVLIDRLDPAVRRGVVDVLAGRGRLDLRGAGLRPAPAADLRAVQRRRRAAAARVRAVSRPSASPRRDDVVEHPLVVRGGAEDGVHEPRPAAGPGRRRGVPQVPAQPRAAAPAGRPRPRRRRAPRPHRRAPRRARRRRCPRRSAG